MEGLKKARDKMPETVFRRCHHVVSENQRVLDAVKALREGNLRDLGRLMYQSHFSMQKVFEVSCPELDFLVQKTLDKEYIPGGRMMGAGFGGCTINIIEKSRAAAFIRMVSADYRNRFGIELTPIEVAIGDGARLIR